MPQLEQRNTLPVEAIYKHTGPNAPLHVCAEPVELLCEGQKFIANAEVCLNFVPRAYLAFDTTVDSRAWLTMFMSPADGAELRFPERGVSVPVLQTKNGIFVPKSSVVTATRPAAEIQRTICHVFNFPDFYSDTDCVVTADLGTPAVRSERVGRVVLKGGGWIVTIAELSVPQQQHDEFENQGGWLLTHAVEIVRDDGLPYTSERLEDLLHSLHCCLSFAMGRWVGLAMPIGFDAQGHRVFEQWGMPIASEGAWNGSITWFDAHHGESLTQLFPGFYALWSSERWRRPIEESIYWHLAASERGTAIGVDTALVIAQTALELLAWNYCVRDRRMVSEEAFKPRGLCAADRFRLLVSSLGIPAEIPNALRSLHAKRGKKWGDALDVITDVRNSLVHPHDERKLPEGTERDVWFLSIWYLQMIILRLCDYRGVYGNCLILPRFVGQVEQVPWALRGPQKP